MISDQKYPHRVDLHQSSQDYRKGTLPLSNILVHYPLTDVQKFIPGEREHSLPCLGFIRLLQPSVFYSIGAGNKSIKMLGSTTGFQS